METGQNAKPELELQIQVNQGKATGSIQFKVYYIRLSVDWPSCLCVSY